MPKIKTYSPEEVVQLCAEYMNETHVAFVQKACDFAREAHSGQMRKSGEEYFVHPTQVAAILADLKLDPETIATGFLHDVVEDTEYLWMISNGNSPKPSPFWWMALPS